MVARRRGAVPTTGAVGDWYLDTTSYDAYEKGAGGWIPVVNLRGPIGPKGRHRATRVRPERTGANGHQRVRLVR